MAGVVLHKSVTLKLDEHEAMFLLQVMNAIGGSTKNSPRKYADRIVSVLNSVGFTYDYENPPFKVSQSQNSIYFKDQEGENER